MTTLTCGLIQMNSGNDWQKNLADAERYMRQAVSQGAELVVLPENALCFGQSGLAAFAPHVESCIRYFQSLVDELSCSLVCGSVPVKASVDAPKYRSRSYLLSPGGDAVYYDKVHLFDVDVNDGVGSYRESDTYEAGSQPVVDSVLGNRIGLSVCYDVRFPELYQAYMKQDVSLITVPSAFTYATGKVHWEILLRARAIETQSFVLAANQCGEHDKGRKTWGHSMVLAPDGQILAACDEEPGVCVAKLDFSLLKSVRAAMPLRNHKRLI